MPHDLERRTRFGETPVPEPPRFVVVTGGPRSGKSTVLAHARRRFSSEVRVLPEAAATLFESGFPRGAGDDLRRAAQSAIFHVEVALERATCAIGGVSVALCDRGTLDVVARWPGRASEFYAQHETSLEREIARYAAVIHLRTHPAAVDVDDVDAALALDDRIRAVWRPHPRVMILDAVPDFDGKVECALDAIEAELARATARL
jgi:hypothetical protein